MAMQKRCRLEAQCRRNSARHDFMGRMEKEAEIKEEQEKAEHSRRDRLVIELEIETQNLHTKVMHHRYALALSEKANEELKKECKRLTTMCNEAENRRKTMQDLEIMGYRRALGLAPT